jgi:hypothetical protein
MNFGQNPKKYEYIQFISLLINFHPIPTNLETQQFPWLVKLIKPNLCESSLL